MLAVSAQATTCEPHLEGTPDNANQIEPNTPANDAPPSDPDPTTDSSTKTAALSPADPSALAARILQRSARRTAEIAQSPRKPSLLVPDDAPLDMPGILMPAEPSDWSPPRLTRGRPRPNQHGPSFKTLLASTVLLAVAGSGAIALGLPDRMASPGTPAPVVETQTITTLPKQDRDSPRLVGETGQAARAEKAADRIQQAFAETASGTPSKLTSYQAAPPDEPAASRTLTGDVSSAGPGGGGAPVDAPLHPVSLEVSAASAPGEDGPSASSKTTRDAVVGTAAPAEPAGTGEPSHETGIITASVNLRQTGSNDGTVIGLVPQGAEVEYTDCGKWWCEVRYDGKSGFVGQKFIKR